MCLMYFINVNKIGSRVLYRGRQSKYEFLDVHVFTFNVEFPTKKSENTFLYKNTVHLVNLSSCYFCIFYLLEWLQP